MNLIPVSAKVIFVYDLHRQCSNNDKLTRPLEYIYRVVDPNPDPTMEGEKLGSGSGSEG